MYYVLYIDNIYWEKIKCGTLGNFSSSQRIFNHRTKKGSGLEQIMDGYNMANDDGRRDFLSLS